MPVLHTSAFIRRSPAECREIFLDFPSWSTWHSGFMKSIKPTVPNPTTLTPSDLHGSSSLFVPGNKLTIAFDGMTITPVLLVNNEGEFKWRGGNLWVGFQGDHDFRWEEAEEGGVRGTRLVHEEVFSGFLSWIMGDNWLASVIGFREQTRKNFQGWTDEFKKRCEEEPKKVV